MNVCKPALVAALFALLPVFTLADDTADLEAARIAVAGMFETIGPENVRPSQIDGLFEISKSGVVAYVSMDGRYLIQGDMIDLNTQVNLSEQSRTGLRRELMSDVGDNKVIKFSPAEVKYSVAVFTDVDCTYCRRLHADIDQYLDRGIEVRYILYPRNGPASKSWNIAEDIWCSNDRQNALTLAKLDREFETRKCESSIVQDNFVLGRNAGLTGTPAIVLEDGTLIGGYLPAPQLLQQLELKAAAAP